MSQTNFATFSATYPVNVPEGVTVYSSRLDGDKVVIEAVATKIIPANTGVIIGGSGEKGFSVATEEGSPISTVLTAAPNGIKSDGTIYGLLKDENMFARVKQGTSLAAHTAYLKLTQNRAPKLSVVLGDGNTTSIGGIDSTTGPENKAIYNLNGQRMSTVQKGVNIIGGKKVIIK